MRLHSVLKLGIIIALSLCGLIEATAQQQIAWGDFSGITNPNGGSAGPFDIHNMIDDGSLTFEATLNDWDTDNSTFNYLASGGTDAGLYTWNDSALSLIGLGGDSYSATFDNISSHDGSLYLSAGAFENDNILSVLARDVTGAEVDLAGTAIVGQWSTGFFGSLGTPTWDGSTGLLDTRGAGSSGANVMIDFSGLGISRLDLSYAGPAGGAVRTGDRWHVNIAGNAVTSVPEPSSLIVLCSCAAIAVIRRRRN